MELQVPWQGTGLLGLRVAALPRGARGLQTRKLAWGFFDGVMGSLTGVGLSDPVCGYPDRGHGVSQEYTGLPNLSCGVPS